MNKYVRSSHVTFTALQVLVVGMMSGGMSEAAGSAPQFTLPTFTLELDACSCDLVRASAPILPVLLSFHWT